MKKWAYFIFPAIFLVIFIGIYLSYAKEVKAKLAENERAVAAKMVEDAKVKAEAELKAREDAAKRAAERLAEEKKKEAEKLAIRDAKLANIKKDTVKDSTEADRLAKEVGELQVQLDTLRKQKEKANNEALELSKKVELANIERRNAELEIQRTTEMVVSKAAASPITR